jgi:hypothetical protein
MELRGVGPAPASNDSLPVDVQPVQVQPVVVRPPPAKSLTGPPGANSPPATAKLFALPGCAKPAVPRGLYCSRSHQKKASYERGRDPNPAPPPRGRREREPDK